MLSALRRSVQEALTACPVQRPPALRRSDDPEALLTTDLPMVAEDSTVERFRAMMTEQGWRVWREGAWLLLDAAVPVPAYQVPRPTASEIGCCVSLLLRHPEGPADRRLLRALVKAAESGSPALERLCGQWHADWARALSEHRPLPGGLLPYLCRAENMTK